MSWRYAEENPGAGSITDWRRGEMAERVGFRVTKGLSERVVYRELFPRG